MTNRREAIAALSTLVPTPRLQAQETSRMNIRMSLDGKPVVVALTESATTLDLLDLLPLSLQLEDFRATERIAYLPRKLSTQGAPAAITPKAGDIAYYAPWGNLALFYRDGGHSPGLVHIGRIESGVEQLRATSRPRLAIERLP
jgi:hypothetical protein